eukprot:gene4748-8330_t
MQTPLIMEPTILLEPPSTLALFSPYCRRNTPSHNPQRETKLLSAQFHPYAKANGRNDLLPKQFNTLKDSKNLYIYPQNSSNFILPKQNVFIRTNSNVEQNTKSSNETKFQIGHWTDAEHQAFLKGLKELGRGRWSEIAEHYVPTRSRVQVASHAQKYFEKARPNQDC